MDYYYLISRGFSADIFARSDQLSSTYQITSSKYWVDIDNPSSSACAASFS